MSARNVIFALAVAVASCGPAGTPATPPRTAIVFESADVAKAHAKTAQSHFENWVRAAINEPRAAYDVLVSGDERSAYRAAFTVRVPESFGGNGENPLGAKAAWIAAARREFSLASQTAFSRPAATSLVYPISDPNGVTIVPPTDARGRMWSFVKTSNAQHVAIVCDVSASCDACREDMLLRMFDDWMRSGITPHSSFEVWRVGTSISSTRRVVSIQSPPLPYAERIAYILGGRNELRRAAKGLVDDREFGSAIIEAISVAAESLRDKPLGGARFLYILSDLRQVSRFDFVANGTPHPDTFVRWIVANRLAPDLSDVTVSVRGLHSRVAPEERPISPRLPRDLRDVWGAAFAAMAAQSVTFSGVEDEMPRTKETRDEQTTSN